MQLHNPLGTIVNTTISAFIAFWRLFNKPWEITGQRWKHNRYKWCGYFNHYVWLSQLHLSTPSTGWMDGMCRMCEISSESLNSWGKGVHKFIDDVITLVDHDYCTDWAWKISLLLTEAQFLPWRRGACGTSKEHLHIAAALGIITCGMRNLFLLWTQLFGNLWRLIGSTSMPIV